MKKIHLRLHIRGRAAEYYLVARDLCGMGKVLGSTRIPSKRTHKQTHNTYTHSQMHTCTHTRGTAAQKALFYIINPKFISMTLRIMNKLYVKTPLSLSFFCSLLQVSYTKELGEFYSLRNKASIF